ncbi:hypothetical protein H2203_001158 [Taxawa tesnikishii (nom. ined.)]|nr:hypothetical protein H2203_001158 [Dothideales sp. JES 119]
MPAPVNTLLIEGSFEELCDELAAYLDQLNSTQGQQTSLQSELAPLLQQDSNKDDVLKKIVTASTALSNAPERARIHRRIQPPRAPDSAVLRSRHLPPRLCQNLSQPITSSPYNSTGLALNVLSTVFNTLSPDQDSRYHVLLAILKIIRTNSTWDQLRPQLKNLETWLAAWEMEKEEQRKLYLTISDLASDAGEPEEAYQYLLRALRTLQEGSDAQSEEAKSLSLRALSAALSSPTHFDFQDLTALDSIQALRQSSSEHFELLEVFAAENLDDYADFKESHDSFLESASLDDAVLTRKMRLLTLASLSAFSASRSLPYSQIAKALQVPSEDVEMWVIDVIRAGLVEGKLSQQSQTFLIHRSTYRVFGEHQWREVASRLDMWRNSLLGVLQVVRQEKENFIREKEQEIRDADQKASGQGYRPNRQQRNAVEVE